jgi:hypothetical protein
MSPSPLSTHLENLTVLADGTPGGSPLASASGILHVDSGDEFKATTGPDGRLSFAVAVDPVHLGWGADLTVSANGFRTYQGRVVIGFGDHELSAVTLARLAPPISQVKVEGRRFVAADGKPFVWRGATGFRAVEQIARGQATEADAFFGSMAAHGVTVVRVLTMAANLFKLPPQQGAEALPQTLALARKHGLYVEAVALADTKSYQFDHEVHVRAIGEACKKAGNCFVEIANEPRHTTQDGRLAEPTYLSKLREVVPAPVLVALGASHGGDDESRDFVGGDYVTVHGSRQDGDEGWRYVRHTNEQRALSEAVNKPVANDEPRRDDLAPEKHLAMALLCRISGLGDTFHFAAGLHARPPEGAEAEALKARRQGWDLIPADFVGGYRNVGHAGSPVKEADFSTVVRMYSAIRGNEAYTLAIGARPAGARFEWADSWPTRTVLAESRGVCLWRVGR